MTAPDHEPICGPSCTPDCGMGHCYLTDGTYIDPEDDHKLNEHANEHALRDKVRDTIHAASPTCTDYHAAECRPCTARARLVMRLAVQPELDAKDAEIKRLHVEVSRFQRAWEDAMADGDQQAVQRLGLRNQLNQERQRAEAAERRVANLQATLTEVTSNNDRMRAELDVFRAIGHHTMQTPQIGDLP